MLQRGSLNQPQCFAAGLASPNAFMLSLCRLANRVSAPASWSKHGISKNLEDSKTTSGILQNDFWNLRSFKDLQTMNDYIEEKIVLAAADKMAETES